MLNTSRSIAALAALCVTAACSDSRSLTAPVGPTAIARDLISTATCSSELTALRATIGSATFGGKKAETERTNLLLKVNAIETELSVGKTADAIKKLEDVRSLVLKLSTADESGKAKLDPADAAIIDAELDAVAACIQPTAPAAGA